MTLTTSPARADQKLTGQALRNIREERRKGQRFVAEALGMTTQAYQKYEAGERKFTEDRISMILEILQSTPEQLDFERARILGAPPPRPQGVADVGRQFVLDVYGRARVGPRGPEVYEAGEAFRKIDLRQILGPNTDAMEVADERMIPWAAPGEVVIFDRDRPPRPGFGCVIEMHTGEAFVRLYERSDGSTLFARELNPEEKTVNFDLKKIKGIYAVKLRGD